MSSTVPPKSPDGQTAEPGLPAFAQGREGKPVSFYVAIFLALLLLVSGALNLLLLVVSAFGGATSSGIGGTVVEDDGVMYKLVAVAGDARAESSILRVPIDGAISEVSSPLLGAAGGTVSQVKRALRAAERQSSIKGILLDINSPGGGVTDSDEIWRLISDFKENNKEVTVMALMGDMATSGGYYVAAACDEILARPTTITGSIGVIISTFNYGKGLKELGVEAVTIISPDTPYKDMLSPTRPMRPEEEAKIQAIVQEMYERFVDIVNQGRPELTREDVKALATGEIYSAAKAHELGLVDGIADFGEALELMEERIDADSVRVVEHRRVPTFFDTLFRTQPPRASVDQAIAQLLRSSTGPKFLYYWPGGR